MGRVAAIDYGLKRTGIALSDPSRTLASPLTTLSTPNTLPKCADLILQTLAPHNPDLILLGHPLHLDGRPSPMARHAEELREVLQLRTDVEVRLWDERLSTAQADRLMRESGVRRKKRAAAADELAAVIVLQSFLDQ